jgi:hypothetical protein
MASHQADHINNEPPPAYTSATDEATSSPLSPASDALSSPLSPQSRREVDMFGDKAKRSETGFSSFDKIADRPPGRLLTGDLAASDDEDDEYVRNAPARTATDFITEVIHAEDDPTLNPWTFRTWFVGTRPWQHVGHDNADRRKDWASRRSVAHSGPSTTSSRRP